ncbi:MAG TPA: prepilin peptidase [Clostridiales bacterium]|nr:prepilin peptidase [Clostridiales bacterium]
MLSGERAILLLAAGALGVAVGSFLCVCIHRLPQGLSVFGPPSHCPACGRRLTWWELVPLVGYVLLGGRCRTCRSRISPVYPLVELGTAVLFVASVLTWGLSVEALSAVLLGSLIIVGGTIDTFHQRIPDVVTLPGIALGLSLSLFNPQMGALGSLLGLLVGGGFLLAVAVASGGGMGGGDVKFAAMMGAFLGVEGTLAALLVGFVAGALVGGAALAAGRKRRRDFMAFGPFLGAGGLVALFWGRALIAWYVRVFWG